MSKKTSQQENSGKSNYGSISNDQQSSSEILDNTTTSLLPSTSSSISNENLPETSSTTANSNSNNNCNQQMESTLTFMQKWGYGLGHVHNDLCSGVWFSYTLLFMQSALKLPGQEAGALVMLGQVGDAIATPIVGILADRYLTKREWHIIGSSLVFVSFPLIFSICPGCTTGPIWWQPTYYSIVVLLFQCGWAIVQISHLAMIPEMSKTRKDRADLTAIRYSASICANVMVYVVTWAVLHARNMSTHSIGPSDAYRFRDISLILTLTGITMTVCFYFSLFINENRNRRHQQQINRNVNNDDDVHTPLIRNSNNESTSSTIAPPITIVQQKNFLKSALLYKNALLYVFARLFLTTSLVYIPLWINERSWTPITSSIYAIRNAASNSNNSTLTATASTNSDVENIATIPLMSFLSSFIASIIMKQLNSCYGHKMAYLFGSIICIFGCITVYIAAPLSASPLRLYMIAILFGSGSSITMISSLCITADMIGKHSNQGGFIYSAVTFADKLITGIVVIVIETIKCDNRKECPEYYRNVLSYACGAATVLGLVTLLTLQCNRSSNNRRRQNLQIQNT